MPSVRALHSVVNPMRRSRQILLSIALVFACGYASAAETQHMSADGGTGCPDNTATSNDRSDLGDTDPSVTTVVPVHRIDKAKAAAAPHSNSGTRATAPRWHSFLPGMFR